MTELQVVVYERPGKRSVTTCRVEDEGDVPRSHWLTCEKRDEAADTVSAETRGRRA